MPLEGNGRATCTACDWNKEHAKVDRWFDERTFEWRYTRRCAWCGSVFPATQEAYAAENPDDPNKIWGELVAQTQEPQ